MTWRFGCFLALLTGLFLRLPGLFTSLWIDEVWTVELVRAARHPLEIFTRLQVDNNHLLNSLLMYPLRSANCEAILRLPAFVAGAILPPVVALLDSRTSRERFFLLAVFGLSFPLIVYSTEARGYSWMLFCGIIAYENLRLMTKSEGTRWSGWCFQLSLILGFLAHISFFFLVPGFLLWAAISLKRDQLKYLFTLPLLVISAIVFVHWNQPVEIAGGPPLSPTVALLRTASLGLNLPPALNSSLLFMWVGAAALTAVLILIARESLVLYKSNHGEVAFFLITCLAIPTGIVLTARYTYFSPRYFLFALPFVLLAFSRFVANHRVGFVVLGIWVLSGLIAIVPFLRYGRGGYFKALQLIAEHDSQSDILIAGTHDAWTEPLIRFYGAKFPKKTFRYCTRAECREAPTWFVDSNPLPSPQSRQVDFGDTRAKYRLFASFPDGGISGFRWGIYRQSDLFPAEELQPSLKRSDRK